MRKPLVLALLGFVVIAQATPMLNPERWELLGSNNRGGSVYIDTQTIQQDRAWFYVTEYYSDLLHREIYTKALVVFQCETRLMSAIQFMAYDPVTNKMVFSEYGTPYRAVIPESGMEVMYNRVCHP